MVSTGVFPLKCSVQTYAWGRPGSSSAVAKLHSGSDDDFRIDEKTPYAELWMGTHPNGPATIKTTGELLSSWLAKNPESLGDKVRAQFGDHLPFLFKVLSVNVALSIQAHPSKEHAAQLHAHAPQHYPDDNHKPEMAIALTDFEGLCGFRPAQQIIGYIRDIPELRAIVGENNLIGLMKANDDDATSAALKGCFTAVMLCDNAVVKDKLDKFLRRVEELDTLDANYFYLCLDLLKRLNLQFPGDRGCFCIYFLNRIQLKPGEAMFLKANLPHAYLAGDCIECMACSDNVVRAGLTPKFIDVPTLCSMLDYSCKTPDENLYVPEPGTDACRTVYNPPVPDFTVTRYNLTSAEVYTITPGDNPGIVLTVLGSGSSPLGEIRPGSIYFIGANQSLTITSTSPNLLLFMAHCLL